MNRKIATLIGLFGTTALACTARTPIGALADASAGTSGTGTGGAAGMVAAVDGGGTCTPPQLPGDQPFTVPAALAGTWNGYFQAFTLPVPSQSDRLTLSLDGATNQVHVVLGTNPAPPPATGPNEIYPPGTTLADYINPITAPYFIEGFSYTAHEVSFDGQRLKFVIGPREAWDSWCRFQPSIPWMTTTMLAPDAATQVESGYACIPGGGGGNVTEVGSPNMQCFASDGQGHQLGEVSCVQYFQCGRCQCDACGCAGSLKGPTKFDLTFSGNAATGIGLDSVTVQLTRARN